MMAMSLDQFRNSVTVILGEDADAIRSRYIESFVDIESARYKKQILSKQRFVDGFYYTGYLWDCLKNASLIFGDEAAEELTKKQQILYVLWDLHSDERIYVHDFWKFPKDAILLLHAQDLVAGLEFLPDDIYVFDDKFDWSIVFTHEFTADQKRYCRLVKA